VNRLIDMTPEERGKWVIGLGHKLRRLEWQAAASRDEIRSCDERLRSLRASLESIEERIGHVYAVLRDFAPAELRELGR